MMMMMMMSRIEKGLASVMGTRPTTLGLGFRVWGFRGLGFRGLGPAQEPSKRWT